MADYTQADVDAIRAAIIVAAKSGGGTVTFGNRTVTANLKELRALLAEATSAVSATVNGSTTRLASFQKGT